LTISPDIVERIRTGQRAVTIGEVVRVGPELKRELERIGQQEFNADAVWLTRRILREWLAARASE
jgi:hypothetical protein